MRLALIVVGIVVAVTGLLVAVGLLIDRRAEGFWRKEGR